METVIIKNNHQQPKEYNNYGGYYIIKIIKCICPRCGTAFIFDDKDIKRPRSIHYTMHDCVVQCPNSECRKTISLDSNCVTKFNRPHEKDEFKFLHNNIGIR